MNQRQKRCLWVGITVFVLMGLFPPWVVNKGGFSGHGYTFLFTKGGAHIDTNLLAIQWVLVAVVTGGLMLTFHGKEVGKSENRRNESHQPSQDETPT
jgi:hypothetical protein